MAEIADVTDGSSNPMLAGDKWVPSNEYADSHWADDVGPMAGWDPDIGRSTVSNPTFCPNPTRDIPLPQSDARWSNCGYVFGSAIAGSGVGWIADRFGWTGVFVTMVVCCILTIGFSAMTLGHRAESSGRN